jgi:hypothetical protein
MLDTLLLGPSIHFTTLHLSTLHYTCRHFTSPHLNFTQLHFTNLSFGLTPFKFPTAQCDTEARSRSYYCRGKPISTKCYECFSVFLPYLTPKQIESFLSRVILSSAACLTAQYFSTFSHKLHDFRIEYKMCVLIFPRVSSGIFLTLRRI